MKKVGIITFHFVNNYGGVLQAYALQNVVSEMGYDVCIIDYRNWFIRLTDAIRIFPISKRIDVIISGFMTMSARKGRIKKINSFVKKELRLSPRVNKFNIFNKCGHFDKYICGSDQIWNPFLTGGVDTSYYLSFVKENCKKIAYAPSFGTGKIPFIFLRKMFNQIKKIDYLSIRECASEQILYDGIGRHADVMVDPTLLIPSDKWDYLGVDVEGLPEKFILLYMMQGDEKIYRYARAMKEKYKLPIVEISRYGFNPGFADYALVDVGIEEFIGLFKKAEYICTNSYHGFVYSIIFKKKFCLIPSVHFSIRIKNLLALLGMSEDDLSSLEELLVKVDYEQISKRLDRYRKNAMDFLQTAIES